MPTTLRKNKKSIPLYWEIQENFLGQAQQVFYDKKGQFICCQPVEIISAEESDTIYYETSKS